MERRGVGANIHAQMHQVIAARVIRQQQLTDIELTDIDSNIHAR